MAAPCRVPEDTGMRRFADGRLCLNPQDQGKEVVLLHHKHVGTLEVSGL